MKKYFFILAIAAGLAPAGAQVQVPQPSPFTKIEQKVGLTDVTLEYSRPGMRDRQIFGDLVPYGETWRTGANDNTRISFSDPVTIDGKELPKGTYAIYTIPNDGEWVVLFYTEAQNWGLPEEWDEEKVALKARAEVEELPFEMETFTILLDNLQNDSADLNFIWERTLASLTFKVPTDQKATASIERALSGPGANDYFAAASYYHDSGKDLEQAHEWITKAVEKGNGNEFWVLRRKSLIEAELGLKEEAILTARQSLEAAEKAGNKDYVKMNRASLQEWGAE